MKILVFDADARAREVFTEGLQGHELTFFDESVSLDALHAHTEAEAVSFFVSSMFQREHIDALPNLKLIVARSAGFDNIDCAHAKEKNIVVSRVPKYGQHTVAEFTFALILALSRNIVDASFRIRENGDFSFKALEGFDLFDKTLGVVGTGAIGRAVVGIAQGFGMNVLMHDMHPADDLVSEHAKYFALDELLAQSDIITLHVPYMQENHHMLSREQFAKMKRGALIINTARGELIDTECLVEALRSGQVGGAGLDVLEKERALKDEMEMVTGMDSAQDLKTLIRDSELMHMPHVIVTPHMAFYSREAYTDILNISVADVKAFLDGAPINIVSA